MSAKRSPGWASPRLWPTLARRVARRSLPRSLFARSVLIILLPVVVMQAAVGWAFFEAHWRTVTRQLSESLAADVAWDTALYQADPQALPVLIERAEKAQSISIALQEGRDLPAVRHARRLIPSFDDALRTAVDDRLSERFWLDTTRYPAYVDIRVAVKGGTLRFLAPRERAFSSRGQVFVVWLLGATLLLSGVAIAFVRNQVRAIERLAAAADAFGRGQDAQDFKPHGAREVRRAGEAFLAMRARIQRHLDQRTNFLASVSHDLRTPLTRLKLQVALAEPSPRIEEVKRDLVEMEHMIDEYLAFAGGQGGEGVEAAAMGPLLEEVRADALRVLGGKAPVLEVAAEAGLTAPVRPQAFKRALSNLVMNAASHGRRVQVAARATAAGGVEVSVDDDGPGIAPDRYEEAFRPFNRLDPARNQNKKGVGLGLAIARDMARGHGGDVELGRSALGGLRAVVRLPG